MKKLQKLEAEEGELVLKGELFEALAQNTSLEKGIQAILQILTKFYDALIGECWLNSPGIHKDLTFFTTYGDSKSNGMQSDHRASGSGFIGELYNLRKPIVLTDLQLNEGFLRKDFAKKNDLTSAMGIPLVINGKVSGVFCFFRQQENFSQSEVLSRSMIRSIALWVDELINKQLNEAFFRLSNSFFVIGDMNGNFLQVNHAFLQSLGYKEEEVIGQSYTKFIHPDDIKPSVKNTEKVFKGQPTIVFENRYRSKSGDYIWISWSTITHMDRKLVYAYGKDITELKVAQHELEEKSFNLKERVKELNGLYSILKILSEPEKSFDDKLSLIIEFIPSSFQFPEITCAAIEVGGKRHKTTYFRNSNTRLSAPIVVGGETVGRLTVYLTGNKQHGFLREEESLVETVVSNISRALELEKSRSLVHRLSLIAKETINFVFICDEQGRIEWANDAFVLDTGYNLEEIEGKKPADFLHGPETDHEVRDQLHNAVINHEPFSCELLKYKKDKTPYWVSIEGKPLKDPINGSIHYFQIETDITGKRKDQQLLREAEQNARRFASELNRVLEEERAHWAREIHDEFGQQLSGIKMSLATLNRINFEPEASQLIVTDVVKSLEEATKSLKAFSTQLRPGILDSLGISEAISWLVDEFAKKSGTKVKKQIESNGVTLDNSTSNAIFRICQETLNNIAKHANATLIEVGFYIDDEEVTLSIIDNGVGMRDSSLNDPFSMGLLGMKERAHLAGGSLEIESDEGKYTKVKYHQLLTAENE